MIIFFIWKCIFCTTFLLTKNIASCNPFRNMVCDFTMKKREKKFFFKQWLGIWGNFFPNNSYDYEWNQNVFKYNFISVCEKHLNKQAKLVEQIGTTDRPGSRMYRRAKSAVVAMHLLTSLLCFAAHACAWCM